MLLVVVEGVGAGGGGEAVVAPFVGVGLDRAGPEVVLGQLVPLHQGQHVRQRPLPADQDLGGAHPVPEDVRRGPGGDQGEQLLDLRVGVDQVKGVARVLAFVHLFEGLVELRRGLVAAEVELHRGGGSRRRGALAGGRARGARHQQGPGSGQQAGGAQGAAQEGPAGHAGAAGVRRMRQVRRGAAGAGGAAAGMASDLRPPF